MQERDRYLSRHLGWFFDQKCQCVPDRITADRAVPWNGDLADGIKVGRDGIALQPGKKRRILAQSKSFSASVAPARALHYELSSDVGEARDHGYL